MGERRKILVVDDEAANRSLMEAMLIPLNYEIVLANDGTEALEKAVVDSPDIILLDIMMPKMNGFDVVERLKGHQRTCMIPIVMVTSLQDVENRVRALEAGADDFLTKPVDKTELRARVRSLLKVKEYNDHMKNYQKELESEVARRTEQLSAAFERIRVLSLDTIFRLTRAAEYKDSDTGIHIVRISDYAATIARKLCLDEKSIENIQYASPMHDVGKIGIPEKILLKPGRLTDEEWDIMKSHTVIGARILEGSESEIINLAREIALSHHECWEGSGYPYGLRHSQIPLAGRITAIADVFDALISKRPYKEPYPLEKAFQIIADGRKSRFDPDVADAFFGVTDELRLIGEKHRKSPGNALRF